MTEEFAPIPLRGQKLEPVSPDKLTIVKARETARVLASGAMNWVEFIECYQHSSSSGGNDAIIAETVVFETEVELPQFPVYEIRERERIAVTFGRSDERYPGVYALRRDFPEVSHLNLELFELPRSLCLYNKPYSDVKLGWTAIAFVERIRNWLSDNASGVLHKRDQALEPLLAGADAFIVLPPDFPENFDEKLTSIKMRVDRWDNGRLCFTSQDAGRAAVGDSSNNPVFSVVAVLGEPQQHGRIRHKPDNLSAFDGFLQSAKIDLTGILRSSLKDLISDAQTLTAGLIIMVVLPKTRTAAGAVETNDVWAFVCVKDEIKDGDVFFSVRDVGEEIGLWDVVDGKAGFLLSPDTTKTGEAVKLLTLAPCSPLSRENAPLWSGTKKRIDDKIIAVGMGALGSQIFLNLIRAGDGEWTLVDNDVLLPHNFVRHAAYGSAAGYAKASFSALIANATIKAPPIASAIVADVLAPGKSAESISKSFSEAATILDFSASQAVARHLALDVAAKARRISLFLNPAGTDLVLLAEDADRAVPLDSLEMQYYRMLINMPELKAHLEPPVGQVRFSASCREVSNQILPESVALAAAIGTRALRQILPHKTVPAISVWQSNTNGEVRNFSTAPARCVSFEANGWTIRADAGLLEKISAWR